MTNPTAPAALKDDQPSGETPGEERSVEEEASERKKSADSGGAELDGVEVESGDDDEEIARKRKALIASGKVGTEFDVEDSRVCHYRDFSHIKAPESLPSVVKRNPPNKEATFPMKLHAIVSSPDFWEIEWLPHGRR
jgi:hypothetical protein